MSADYSKFSVIYGIQLPDGTYAKADPAQQHPLMWDNRLFAENYMEDLRKAAASIGITHWTGRIVKQYTTPFIPDDEDPSDMIAELEGWLREQEGKQ
jgi:hypothetical protein